MESSKPHVDGSDSRPHGTDVQSSRRTLGRESERKQPLALGVNHQPSSVRSLQSVLLKLDVLLFFTLLGATGFAVLYVGRGKVFELRPRPFFLADTTLWVRHNLIHNGL
jgi:hypothetical protein